MLGLRFFACRRCDTVVSVPDVPSRCETCEATSLEEITQELGDYAYFVAAGRSR
ncbi:hypothetical protein [Haloferax sp. YSMS24]|uniref:hypothetical protein n=1 Tax=Haloferax sp. YSMS24 TaxID=3388425 RepID=UPI00398D1023